MVPALTSTQLDQLRASIDGEILTAEHGRYEDARRLWNGVHDLRPSVIVQPASQEGVASALRFARDHDLELAVRSGGHSPAGHSGTDGGLVIDLAGMRGVTVDPVRRVARVNGGALLGEVDVAAQAHGLVCPTGVVGHTGVGGLTLGGGVGRLQRHFGLTIDNLRAVELVTADGRFVRTSEREEPELFWGMRGAGWNFGVATAFEFDLHPFGPNLNRGVRVYPASAARDVWEVFRDYSTTAPHTVSMIYGIAPPEGASDGGGWEPIIVVSFNHSGPVDALERDTAGLRQGPEPLSVSGGPMAYLEAQTAHDLVLGFGHRTFIAGLYANELGLDALDALVEQVAAGPTGGSFSITAQGGAISQQDDDAMAYAGRTGRFDFSADTTWEEPADDERNRGWARETMAIVEPFAIEGRYANENADYGPEQTRLLYGDAKLARLRALKRTWDPDNVLRRNHNVVPAD
jgi:FAD/FMN-containing dehydrogenase